MAEEKKARILCLSSEQGRTSRVVATLFKRASALRLFVFKGEKTPRVDCGMVIALSVAL